MRVVRLVLIRSCFASVYEKTREPPPPIWSFFVFFYTALLLESCAWLICMSPSKLLPPYCFMLKDIATCPIFPFAWIDWSEFSQMLPFLNILCNVPSIFFLCCIVLQLILDLFRLCPPPVRYAPPSYRARVIT